MEAAFTDKRLQSSTAERLYGIGIAARHTNWHLSAMNGGWAYKFRLDESHVSVVAVIFL